MSECEELHQNFHHYDQQMRILIEEFLATLNSVNLQTALSYHAASSLLKEILSCSVSAIREVSRIHLTTASLGVAVYTFKTKSQQGAVIDDFGILTLRIPECILLMS